MEHLRYPIGNFILPDSYTFEAIQGWIQDLKNLPLEFRTIAESLSHQQLNSPYRPDGWTGLQVIHHVADSHMNALVRIKLTLTEENPTVKPYIEEEWAKLADYSLPIEVSLSMIDSIHTHITAVLESLNEADFQRPFTHPQYQYTRPLAYLCALYSWHGKHHTGHLKLL